MLTVDALRDWDLSAAQDLHGMFADCSALKSVAALRHWNTGQVTDLDQIFNGCPAITDLSSLKDWHIADSAALRAALHLNV